MHSILPDSCMHPLQYTQGVYDILTTLAYTFMIQQAFFTIYSVRALALRNTSRVRCTGKLTPSLSLRLLSIEQDDTAAH